MASLRSPLEREARTLEARHPILALRHILDARRFSAGRG